MTHETAESWHIEIMYKNLGETVALIPARKGSQRVPRKNVRKLFGKPLIQYTLDHVYEVSKFDHVVVSTDDEEIIRISESYGATIVDRDPILCTADARMIDVVQDGLHALSEWAIKVDVVFLFQPTSPIRRVSKTLEALDLMVETKCDSVCSLIEVDHFHPNRVKQLVGNQVLDYGEVEINNVALSSLPKVYHRDGSIYGSKVEFPLKNESILGKDVRAVLNDSNYFVNVDTERDWKLAEVLVQDYMLDDENY